MSKILKGGGNSKYKSSNSILSILNPDKWRRTLKHMSSPQYFQITYNYNTPNIIHINNHKNKPIPSSAVEMEPHIVIGNMNRYLIVLVDEAPYNKIYWIAEFANNTKQKNILAYTAPKPNKNEKHNYVIKIYLYPKETTQPYKLSVITDIKKQRTLEYINFIKYITLTKLKLTATFKLNIFKDSNKFTLFNLVTRTSSHNSITTTTPIPIQKSVKKLISSMNNDHQNQVFKQSSTSNPVLKPTIEPMKPLKPTIEPMKPMKLVDSQA